MLTFLHGLLAGVLLSALRAPLGLDPTQVPALEGTTTALFRAGALFAVAVSLDPRRPLLRRGLAVGPWLLGLALGLVVHGLFLLPRFEIGGRVGAAALLLGGAFLLFLVAGRARRGASAEPDPDSVAPLPWLELLGAALVGAGGAIGLDAVERQLRLLALGLPHDGTVIAGVLALLTWAGYVAFGRPHARERGAAALAVGGLLLAPAGLIGLRFLGGLDTAHLWAFLKRFGLDFTQIGDGRATAILACAALVGPAFAAGGALAGGRHAGRMRALLTGAALGVLVTPTLVLLLAHPIAFEAAAGDAFAWRLLASGGAVAAAGALLLGWRAVPGRGRAAVATALALAAGALLLGPRPRVWLVSPWWRTEIQPALLLPTPEGLATVEPSFGKDGGLVATLDRRRLTPLPEEEATDGDRLRMAWALLPAERRASGSARVLFIGQMTPARTADFAALPPHRLDRTAPWASAAGPMEDALFRGESAPPAGTWITPAEARRRLQRGDYDLVVVPPITGPLLYPKSAQLFHWAAPPAPVLSGLGVPEGTTAVVWVDARAPIAGRTLPGPLVPSAGKGWQDLTFGLVLGAEPLPAGAAPDPERPILLPPGPPGPRPMPWSLLFERAELRNYHLVASTTARIAAGAKEEPGRGVAAALAADAAVQVHSSPYDSLAEQLELSEDALKDLVGAARAAAPDAATRDLWEGITWLLVQKREIGMILTYVEPVADAFGPWPPLERAVAHAYEEFDQPADARKWLDRVVGEVPNDIDLLVEDAWWTARDGDVEASAALLERASKLQPERRDLQRLLAMMWVRAGDARGVPLVTRLLAEDPDDSELAAYLGSGPLPPLPEGYLPNGGLDEHELQQPGGKNPR